MINVKITVEFLSHRRLASNCWELTVLLHLYGINSGILFCRTATDTKGPYVLVWDPILGLYDTKDGKEVRDREVCDQVRSHVNGINVLDHWRRNTRPTLPEYPET